MDPYSSFIHFHIVLVHLFHPSSSVNPCTIIHHVPHNNKFLPHNYSSSSEAEGLGCRREKCTPSRLSIGKLLSQTSRNSRAPYFHAPVSPPSCFRNETPCLPIRNFMHMTKQLISTRGASDLPRDAVASPTSLEIQVPPCSRSASAGLRL